MKISWIFILTLLLGCGKYKPMFKPGDCVIVDISQSKKLKNFVKIKIKEVTHDKYVFNFLENQTIYESHFRRIDRNGMKSNCLPLVEEEDEDVTEYRL